MKKATTGEAASMATIKVPESLRRRLAQRRKGPREPLASVIERVLDDDDEAHLELSPSTKRAIAQGRRDIRAGRFKTLEQVRAEMEP